MDRGGTGGGGGIKPRMSVGFGMGDRPKRELPPLTGMPNSAPSPGVSPAIVALATGDRMRL
eukprot:scaffold7946_cov116-Isochrysis_galbana.AAC.5